MSALPEGPPVPQFIPVMMDRFSLAYRLRCTLHMSPVIRDSLAYISMIIVFSLAHVIGCSPAILMPRNLTSFAQHIVHVHLSTCTRESYTPSLMIITVLLSPGGLSKRQLRGAWHSVAKGSLVGWEELSDMSMPCPTFTSLFMQGQALL